ncbi:MAG: hypothetical protein ACRCYU_03260 [Nocardioides sp.]
MPTSATSITSPTPLRRSGRRSLPIPTHVPGVAESLHDEECRPWDEQTTNIAIPIGRTLLLGAFMSRNGYLGSVEEAEKLTDEEFREEVVYAFLFAGREAATDTFSRPAFLTGYPDNADARRLFAVASRRLDEVFDFRPHEPVTGTGQELVAEHAAMTGGQTAVAGGVR